MTLNEEKLKGEPHMKKIVALLSACLLIALTMSSAFAASLNLTYPRNNPDVFTIDVNSAGTAVFVETVLTAKDRHFTHKYESDYYWSSTQFDVLGVNYGTNDAYPVWRVWIVFANDKSFKNIDSVTFVIEGKRYTFTDISDPDWLTKNETSYLEEMLIKFGLDNLDFVVHLEQYCNKLDDVDDFQGTLILHTRSGEDITVSLGGGFALDFVLTKKAYIEMNGLDYIDRVISTPMTTR